jgi:hypothetical protein
MAKTAVAKKKETSPGKIDPFKTKKTKSPAAEGNDTLTPPPEVAQAIDAFRECQDQAKHFEGEATIHKDLIVDYAQGEYTKRVFGGLSKSFKVLGDETMVTYVVMDSSAGLTEEDAAEFTERWGREAAEELIVRDFNSVKFDAEVLEANYDAVVGALQKLPPEVLENLFKPMLMKAAPGAVEKAKHFAKKPDEMRELIKQLKIKNYIK